VPPILTKGFNYVKWKNLAIRRFRNFVKLNSKDRTKVLWRAMRVIPSNVSKYAEMRRLVFNRIRKHLCTVDKKLDEVNSAIKEFTNDSESLETIMEHLLGKLQIHCANAESFHDVIEYENHFDKIGENDKSEELNDCVQRCLNIMLSKICETNKWKRNKIRKCTDSCGIPSDWGKKLFEKLSDIVNLLCLIDCDISKTDAKLLNIKLHEVQEKFTEFEFCKGCYVSKTKKCIYGSDCKDNLNWINALSCHFSGVRTLRRKIYSIRQAIYWLNTTDYINDRSDYKALQEMLNNPDIQPGQVRQVIEKAAINAEYMGESEINRQFGNILDNFYKQIYNFPEFVCSICLRLSKKVLTCDSKKSVPGYDEFDVTKIVVDDTVTHKNLPIHVCYQNCLDDLKNGQIPVFSKFNGMNVDEVPIEISRLNIIELNLIRLTRCFHNIVTLKPYRKTIGPMDFVDAIKGYSIFFPLPVEATAKYLVESLPSDHSLQIFIDCLPTSSQIVWRSLVNLENVFIALDKLKQINHLYRNVEINRAFSIENINELTLSFYGFENELVENDDKNANIACEYTCNVENEIRSKEAEIQESCSKNQKTTNHLCDKSLFSKEIPLNVSMLKKSIECDPYTSVSVESLTGNIELDANDTSIEAYRMQKIQTPFVNMSDPLLDVTSFVELFPTGKFGMNMKRTRKVTASAFVKSRLCLSDSRFRRNKAYLFSELSRHDQRSITAGIYSVTNQRKFSPLTAGQLKFEVEKNDPNLEARLVTMFSKFRGLHEYWMHQKSNLNAMISKFGPATFFLTLGPAEYSWNDMKKYLLHVNGSDFEEKRQAWMCVNDPVSVAVHSRRRFENFLNEVLLKSNSVLGTIEHYYARVEYQLRGAPHIHMLIWVEEAPVLGENDESEIASFIDKYVTCAIPDKLIDPELHELVLKFQFHKCTKRCLKRSKESKSFRCRFGYPR